ncbi:cellulose synthase catalytic subunit [Brachybacterium sp. JHP9]|uniref:Cellulose synthase catalytic subunit n=1 Tax=Brachybacterium equifaecis TaxID=2910770 RepID=A0ABT0QZQ2_9MICO|nr:cellulose synthase catalytic subunit [Brachybacterium equifaecis]MCL6423132.1 cellulose synthase catalytic subunit [Brachybacterium equifaecis]
MIVMTIIATIGVLGYAGFLLQPSHRGDLLPWLIVIISEAILLFHALFAMWTILAGSKEVRTFDYFRARDNLYSAKSILKKGLKETPSAWPMRLNGKPITVDIFITVYGEPIDVIRRTATAAMNVRGKHTVWILDDGHSDEVRALTEEIGCRYIRRLSSNGAKAGNVNHALSMTSGEFYVILDADFIPLPGLLEETLPFFENQTVAFVQSPQTYGNLHNFISRGAGYMQAMFYRFLQPGRNHFNAAFCVGTNVVFRRAAIDDIGGMYTESKSEDVWTSLKLHERGWKSIFLPTTLAIGDAPDTIEAFSKQQLRWATGGFEILLQSNPLSPRRRLTLDQRLMYFVTASHYLTGIVPGLLLLVPVLEIFFDLRPVSLDVTWETWALFYAGFYVVQVALAFFTLGSFRWEVLMLAACSFPIYAKALYNVIIGRDQAWSVTGTVKRRSPFNVMIPQVLTFILLLVTTFVGAWRDDINSELSIATLWAGLNTVILGVFILVAFGEQRETRRNGETDPGLALKNEWVTSLLAAPAPMTTPADTILYELGMEPTEPDTSQSLGRALPPPLGRSFTPSRVAPPVTPEEESHRRGRRRRMVSGAATAVAERPSPDGPSTDAWTSDPAENPGSTHSATNDTSSGRNPR